MKDEKPKIAVVVGPTASGKSSLAVDLALEFEGEVVSADSRQIYKGLDIATNKITKEEMRGVPHHLLDILPPEERFSVAEFKEAADHKIAEIGARGNLSVLAGGTAYYIDAVVRGVVLPEVAPDEELRKNLRGKSLPELQKKLKGLDSRRFESVDKENPRRLIRAIEIAETLGKVPKTEKKNPYDSLLIGLKLSREELARNIASNTKRRMENGMIEEVKKLHDNGLTLKRMRELGLEYSALADFLDGDMASKEELVERIEVLDRQYAKRQMTWLKKNDDIEWFHPSEREEIKTLVRNFLENY